MLPLRAAHWNVIDQKRPKVDIFAKTLYIAAAHKLNFVLSSIILNSSSQRGTVPSDNNNNRFWLFSVVQTAEDGRRNDYDFKCNC